MKLSDLKYERPDIEAYQKTIYQAIEDVKAATSYDVCKSIFLNIADLSKKIYGSSTLVAIRYSQDTSNEFYEKEQDFFDNVSPQLQKLGTDFTNAVLDSPYRKELELDFGRQYFDIAELQRKSINEAVMPLLQKENQLSSEYQKIMSQIQIEFEGKRYNSSAMKPFLEHIDRAIRKKASDAYYTAMLTHQADFDRIYDELVAIRVEIASKLDCSGFVELGYMRMSRTVYGADEVKKYREFIHKYVTPKAAIIRTKIQSSLGIEKMYQYDGLLFRDGNARPKTSPEQMIADAQVMYNEMSKETGVFFNSMQDKGMLDLLNRDNKSPGGYCTYVEGVKSPFIFSNFNGTSGDVDVLTHEAGHAFQCYCSMNFPLAEYYFPTSESAEIHSMSMEFFAWRWVDKFFKEDTNKYKLGHIMSAFLFLPYGATVDEFQHEVYQNPTWTPEQRRNAWLAIQSKYMPWVQYDHAPFLENGGRWQTQSHIFQMPFYYIDYTLAQLCAFQFFQKMEQDFDAAWKDYYTLCQAGGSQNFLELLKTGNLQSPFDEKSFERTVNYIFDRINQMYTDYNLEFSSTVPKAS